ncbi:MAG: PEGA domain-containing protein [candidate division WOR-3 bacterium]
MMGVLTTLGITILGMVANPGFLTVRSRPAGFAVYVEGESIGTTPIERYQFAPGRYWVTVVSNDSLEVLYKRLRYAGVGAKLAALWSLARIDAASTQVDLLPGFETKVEIDKKVMDKSACRAKWIFGGTVGGIFGLGVIIGVVAGLIAN